MDSNVWWIGPLVIVGLRLVWTEALLGRPEARGALLVFRTARSLRAVLAVGLLGILFATIVSGGHEETWVLVIAAGLVAALCFGWPSTIMIGDADVRSSVWWRPTVAIRWGEVTGIEKRAGGELSVFGGNGETIAFSRYHVDPRRFEAEVLQRANLDSVIDASRPPTMRF